MYLQVSIGTWTDNVVTGIVAIIIIATSAVWVYADASANRIGDISEHRINFSASAVTWAIATLVIWPIVFPSYLKIRGKLADAAIDHPVDDEWRSLKMAAVTAAAVGFVTVSIAFPGAAAG